MGSVTFDYPTWAATFPELAQSGLFTFTGSIAGSVLTVAALSSGLIGIGLLLLGNGISAGTTVTGYEAASGMLGTYDVSNSQTVSSETITASPAQIWFNNAGVYLDNSGCSPVTDLGQRTIILNLITAHLVALNAATINGPASPLVGRISDAAEGSVSVSADMGTQPMPAAWWNQTRYGAQAWTLMAPYRTAQYIPAPRFRGYPGIYGQRVWP